MNVNGIVIFELGPINNPSLLHCIRFLCTTRHQHTKKQVDTIENTPAPRVESPKITTSVDASNRKHCKSQKQVHQKNTRDNTPITATPEEILDNNCKTDPGTKLPRVELIQRGTNSRNSLSPLVHAAKTTPPIIS